MAPVLTGFCWRKAPCLLPFLFELLHIYTPSRTLRSSSDSRMLKIQQYKRKTHGFRTFTYFGRYVWNSLQQDIRQCSTLPPFKTKLSCFHSTSVPVDFRSNFSYQKLYLCVCVNANVCAHVCVCVLMLMCVYCFAPFICLLVMLLCVCVCVCVC